MSQDKSCYSEEEIYDYSLDLAEGTELNEEFCAHIKECASCSRALEEAQEIGDAVKENMPASSSQINICPSIGKYRVSSLVGTGGMGRVYKAQDPDLERNVAIKVMKTELSEDPEFRQRFLSEAKILAGLNHPNIIHIYLSGIENHEIYLVMEYVEGESLDSYIKKDHSIEENLKLGVQIVKGIKAAHLSGVIHRDIKPSNIVINNEGEVKLLDFGLARSVITSDTLTLPGHILGTLAYMAPEVAKGESATEQSDIYSLGMVFFEMLTGQSVYGDASPLKVIEKVKTEELPSLTETNPRVPLGLDSIVRKMCAHDLNERYASLADMEQELQSFLQLFHTDKQPHIKNYKDVLETMQDFNIPRNEVPGIISQALSLTQKQQGFLEENNMYSIAHELNIPGEILRSVVVKHQREQRTRAKQKSVFKYAAIALPLLLVISFALFYDIPPLWQGGKQAGDNNALASSGLNEANDTLSGQPLTQGTELIGRWSSVDFVDKIGDFSPQSKSWKNDLFLKTATFKADGSSSLAWTWQGEHVIHSNGKTKAKYHLVKNNNEQYLYLPWLSGDVTIRGQKPKYYVLRKTKLYRQSHYINLDANGGGLMTSELTLTNNSNQSIMHDGFRNDDNSIIKITDGAGDDMHFEAKKVNGRYQYRVSFNQPVLPGEEYPMFLTMKRNNLTQVKGEEWTYNRRHFPGPETDYKEEILLPKGASLTFAEPQPARTEMIDKRMLIQYVSHLDKKEGFTCVIKYTLPEKTITVPNALLESYVGQYQLGPHSFFDVKRKGQNLTVQLTGQSRFPVYPINTSLFAYKVVEAKIQFNLGQDGGVKSLSLHQNGIIQEAKKVDPNNKTELPETIELSQEKLKTYIGTYRLTPEHVFTISLRAKQLMAQLSGQQNFPVYAKSKHVFYYKVVFAELHFIENKAGEIIALELHQNGAIQRAEKE
ncbi:MAG: protein kinase [Planctomycetes bacterium]|nr:protein kinase [Planctomycetota bacterium]